MCADVVSECTCVCIHIYIYIPKGVMNYCHFELHFVITADKKNYLCQSVVWIGCFIVIMSGQFNPKKPQVSAGTAVKHSELQV